MDKVEITTPEWWRPSSHSVYSLLDQLQKEGSISKRDDDRYELTEKGKEEFDWPLGIRTRQPRSFDDIISEVSRDISFLEDLNRSDRSKVAAKLEQLKSFRDRLTVLIGSK